MTSKQTGGRGRGGGEKKRPSGKKDYHVTPEQFIKVWQTSNSAQEAADKLGMPKVIALARASAYRKEGINIKHMRRKPKKSLDVDALNRLIDKLDAGASPEELEEEEDDEPTPATIPFGAARNDPRARGRNLA